MPKDTQPPGHLDLPAIARQAMIEAGFSPDTTPAIRTEVLEIESIIPRTIMETADQDLRGFLWSSIDNTESRDLDQVEFAEQLPNGSIRVRVGIADVDALVPMNRPVDMRASQNATSVYTGFQTFAMLPEELSTNLTSLIEGADRSAVVIELDVASDGRVEKTSVYSALLTNRAKLSYDGVGAWLDSPSKTRSRLAGVPGLEEQLLLQFEASRRLQKVRKEKGSLELETIQTTPVVDDTGRVTHLEVSERNSARDIIENFMVATNVAIAEFLEEKGTLSLRRIVRTPKQWPRIVEIARALGEELPSEPNSLALAEFLERQRSADPLHFADLSLSIVKLLGPGEYVVQTARDQIEGHFGLAVSDYTHSTAPNRRFADLVTQRILKATIGSVQPPYDENQLNAIAAHCTEREDAARKVERKMRKVGAALLLQDKIGDKFDAIVTGVTPRGTFARTIKPPVDGMIVRGQKGLRVGEKIRVKLLSTDPPKGFIDFARVDL